VKLADETKASAAASFDFTSLPGGYSALMIVWSGRSANASNSDIVLARFNNDSGNNYDRQRRENPASTTLSEVQNLAGASVLSGNVTANSSTSGWAGSGEILVVNYAGTTFHKIARSKSFMRTSDGSVNNDMGDQGAIWKNTAAIDRVTLFLNSGGNWMAGSRCTIYGLP